MLPIQNVTKGTQVLSMNDDNQVVTSEVTQTFVHPNSRYLKLTFDDGTVMEATEIHPIYVRESRAFVPAGQLKADMTVKKLQDLKSKGQKKTKTKLTVHWLKIKSIQVVDRDAPVYNLEVADTHTYFAGDVLVHNKIMTCLEKELAIEGKGGCGESPGESCINPKTCKSQTVLCTCDNNGQPKCCTGDSATYEKGNGACCTTDGVKCCTGTSGTGNPGCP